MSWNTSVSLLSCTALRFSLHVSQVPSDLQLTTNLIKKAEEGVNGLMAKLGAPADLSQHSPHASVQQLLHATKSLTELNAGSALANLQVCNRL